MFNSGFSENHRLKSPIIAWAPILSNLGVYRSNSARQLALQQWSFVVAFRGLISGKGTNILGYFSD